MKCTIKPRATVNPIIHPIALKFVKICSSISNGLYIKPRATFNEIHYKAESHIESNHPSNGSEVLQSQPHLYQMDYIYSQEPHCMKQTIKLKATFNLKPSTTLNLIIRQVALKFVKVSSSIKVSSSKHQMEHEAESLKLQVSFAKEPYKSNGHDIESNHPSSGSEVLIGLFCKRAL